MLLFKSGVLRGLKFLTVQCTSTSKEICADDISLCIHVEVKRFFTWPNNQCHILTLRDSYGLSDMLTARLMSRGRSLAVCYICTSLLRFNSSFIITFSEKSRMPYLGSCYGWFCHNRYLLYQSRISNPALELTNLRGHLTILNITSPNESRFSPELSSSNPMVANYCHSLDSKNISRVMIFACLARRLNNPSWSSPSSLPLHQLNHQLPRQNISTLRQHHFIFWYSDHISRT